MILRVVKLVCFSILLFILNNQFFANHELISALELAVTLPKVEATVDVVKLSDSSPSLTYSSDDSPVPPVLPKKIEPKKVVPVLPIPKKVTKVIKALTSEQEKKLDEDKFFTLQAFFNQPLVEKRKVDEYLSLLKKLNKESDYKKELENMQTWLDKVWSKDNNSHYRTQTDYVKMFEKKEPAKKEAKKGAHPGKIQTEDEPW